MTNETNTTETTETHFFASCGLGWSTAATREEAIANLVNRFRSEFKAMTTNSQKAGELGGYIWSCEVLAPEDASYKIQYFAPQEVEIQEAREHFTTYVTGKKLSYATFAEKVPNNTSTVED